MKATLALADTLREVIDQLEDDVRSGEYDHEFEVTMERWVADLREIETLLDTRQARRGVVS